MTQNKSSEEVIDLMLEGLWAQYGVADHRARQYREQADGLRNQIVELQTTGRNAAEFALASDPGRVAAGLMSRPGVSETLSMRDARAEMDASQMTPAAAVEFAQMAYEKGASDAKPRRGRKPGRKPKAAAAVAAAPARRGRKPGRKPKAEAIVAAPKKRGRPPGKKAKNVVPRRKRSVSTELPQEIGQVPFGVPGPETGAPL